MTIKRVRVTEYNGKYRLVDTSTGDIAHLRGKELDGGGHYIKRFAQAQAKTFNARNKSTKK